MAVCAQCFADRRLIAYIRRHGRANTCRWCGAVRTRVVELEVLGPLFRQVAEVYDQAEDEGFEESDWISVLLQDDWQLFSERTSIAPESRMQHLAVAILEAGLRPDELYEYPRYRDLFVKKDELRLSVADLFYMRLQPREPLVVPELDETAGADVEGFPDTVGLAVEDLGHTYSCNRVFYRARRYAPDRLEPYAAHELLAPPPDMAPDGRGNRRGEPVLYTTTHPMTAVAEVRARPGEYVGLGCIRLQRPQKVLDLVHLPYFRSPFFEENLRWKVEALDLLASFGDELSMPVADDDDPEQYTISQEACDAIRSAGFDGVAYPSGRGLGHNVFFFDPAVGRITRHRILRVTDLQPTFETVDRPNAG